MKIKTIFKILIVFLILIMFANVVEVFAGDLTYPKQFDGYDETEIPGTSVTAEGFIVQALGVILSICRIFTLGWGVIMCLAIAVKFMIAKPEIKATLKLDLPTYIIGAVLLFGASGIMTLLKYFVDDTVGS